MNATVGPSEAQRAKEGASADSAEDKEGYHGCKPVEASLGPRRIFLEKLSARIEGNTVEPHLIVEMRIRALSRIAYVGNPLVLPDFLSFHNVNLR